MFINKIAKIIATILAGATLTAPAATEMELTSRVYDADNDIMICEFSDANGNNYVIEDFTAPFGSKYSMFLDNEGNPTRIIVDTKLNEYQVSSKETTPHLSTEREPDSSNIYSLTGLVTEIDEISDTVWVEDYNGNSWGFYGCEDWMVDDCCSLLMNSKGTADITDDVIVSYRYCAWKLTK